MPEIGDQAFTICEYCMTPQDCIWRYDPYQADINNTNIPKWLCDACFHLLCDEI